MIAMLVGCAAPPVKPAHNIVKDADVLDCSADILADLGPLDVAVAMDTSISSMNPSGVDIDGDGSVGTIKRSRFTDPGDSHLSAQVSALRSLVRSAADHDIRFSIVTFSGSTDITLAQKREMLLVPNRDARIHVSLSADTAVLESALDEVLEDGSGGLTNFYAGMAGANRSLLEVEGATPGRRKVVLFMSDSPVTSRLDVDGSIKKTDVRMAHAARQALRHRIIFNTFGLSEKSGAWRRESIGRIAGATAGNYHVVEDPRQLYCHLMSSLATSVRASAE